MTEAETNIRESLLSTLLFLASETQQREFAAKVFYASYSDEFASWWFDTFCPDEPSALHMFSEVQLATLRSFSATFDRNLAELRDGERTIEQLLQEPRWQSIVTSSRTTLAQLVGAI
ncbi:hypothetical protein [Rhodanobacter aciditrophus]|uniref:hypothetical protein n=1 Tax=Rhodanobacter aciditrophus TaxID=1623218 RepID=UPI003CEB488C